MQTKQPICILLKPGRDVKSPAPASNRIVVCHLIDLA
jgi:hypothetical protein